MLQPTAHSVCGAAQGSAVRRGNAKCYAGPMHNPVVREATNRTVRISLLVSLCTVAAGGTGFLARGGTAYAQPEQTASIDGAALERALAAPRAELRTACGRDIPLRIDTTSFLVPAPASRESAGFSSTRSALQVDRLGELGARFSSHVQALCQKDAALAGKVRSLVVRSYEEVADGKQDTADIYVDRLSTGSRYIFAGKAGLRRGNTVYLFDSGVLSAYCDYSESCTETDLRGVPGIGVGTGTAINSADSPRGGSKDGGGGCISVDGEQVCAKGTLGFVGAVESGDCSLAKTTRAAAECQQRLAAVKAFRVEGCAVAQAHAEVVQRGSGFGGHTPNAFFVSVLSRIQDCHDADQLRTVLDARWVVNHRTLTVGGAGYEEETALHRKIRKSVFAACSALRPRIADSRLIGLLYHCAAAADGSLQSYPWPSRKEDESRLRSAQKARIGAEQRDSAAAHADFERRKDLPMAATVCRSAGKKMGSCMSACRKNYTCR